MTYYLIKREFKTSNVLNKGVRYLKVVEQRNSLRDSTQNFPEEKQFKKFGFF